MGKQMYVKNQSYSKEKISLGMVRTLISATSAKRFYNSLLRGDCKCTVPPFPRIFSLSDLRSSAVQAVIVPCRCIQIMI